MKNPFRSLPARIVFFVFAATLITSLTVTAVSVNTIDSFLRDKINQKFPDVLDETQGRLDEWYDGRLREISVFSQSDVLTTNLAVLAPGTRPRRRERAVQEIEQYIAYVLDGFPQYAGLFVLDGERDVRLRVGEEIAMSDAAIERLSAIDQARIGGVRRMNGRLVQIASAPLVDGSGAPLGSLHAVLRLDALVQLLPAQEIGRAGQIFIVDDQGRYLLGSVDPPEVAHFGGPAAVAGEAAVLDDYTNDFGDRVVGGALHFPMFGWTIVVEQIYGEAFEPVISAIGRVLIINLAIVLVVGALAFRIAVSIVRPIDALSDAARRISEGERDVELPESDGSDEVGVLTRAFRAMTTRLTRNAHALQESHEAIEEANERLRLQNDELQRVNEVLEQLSITDGLTKLHNHRYFQEALTQETRRADRTGNALALVLIDIDYFKLWNDRLGHAGGDEILRRIADVMMELVRDTDQLARYGGEEFALIAPGTDILGATMLAEKIRSSVAETAFFRGEPGETEPVTVSIGVAAYEGDRRELFDEADRALYRAKAAGRDCVVTAEPSSSSGDIP